MLADVQFMQKQHLYRALDYHLSSQTAAVVKNLEIQITMIRADAGMVLMPSGATAPGKNYFAP